MIKIVEKSRCCGCNSCVQRCPKQCIEVNEDEEGFLYPQVDQTLCNNCGLCEKICPIINHKPPRAPLHVYVAMNKNESQRLHSSSGGIFILLANFIIGQGGVVFGARFDKKWEVEHCFVENLNEIDSLMRSKYVQSRIGNAYVDAEKFLKEGRPVLFVGTPCQIAGLRRFIHKDYENLLAVDFICHGVPSPAIWRSYLGEMTAERIKTVEKKSNSSILLKTMPVITDINFREKQLSGYSWKKYGFVVQQLPYKGDRNSILLSTLHSENKYMEAFLKGYSLRPSCYVCHFKSGKSDSDITLSDFWGVKHFASEIDDDKGLSTIFVHSKKALAALQKIDLYKRECTFYEGVKSSSYHERTEKPVFRDRFWEKVHKGYTLADSLLYAQNPPLIIRIVSKIQRTFFKK